MIDILKDIMVMLRGMWKYKWLMIGCTWAVAIIGWSVVFALPNQYAASAKVYLDTSSRLRDVVKNLGMEPRVDSKVFLVRQAMLGRPQLEAVARTTDLDLRVTTEEEMEALILHLQNTINLSSGRSRESANLFEISYKDSNRQMSLAVVEALLNNFVENVLSRKDEDTVQATEFLEEQLNYYRNKLQTTELALEVFKREHPAFVQSDNGDGYYERMQTQESQREALVRKLNIETGKRKELQRQLVGSNPYVQNTDASNGVSTAIPGNKTSARIQLLEEQRRDLLLTYTERHPDIVAMNEQVVALKKQLEIELIQLAKMSGADGARSANNPVYVEIQIRLSNSNLEIASIKGEISEVDKTIDTYRSVLDTAPELDREYAELLRDYDQFRGLYGEVFEGSERERIGRVGEQRDVVKFNIIDPPIASLEPVSPPRPLLLFGVLLLAIGAGAGSGFVAFQLKPSFSDTTTLQEMTGVNVLGKIAYAFPLAANMGRRKDVAVFSLAIGGLFVMFVAAVLLVDKVTPYVHAFLQGGPI